MISIMFLHLPRLVEFADLETAVVYIIFLAFPYTSTRASTVYNISCLSNMQYEVHRKGLDGD